MASKHRKFTPAWFVEKLAKRIQRARELLAAEKAVRRYPQVEIRRPHGLPWPLIVSLTSFPARYPTLHKTLRSLLDQSVRPDALVLWVAHDDLAPLPEAVLELKAQGLEIRTCDDTRSFKKIIPALAAYPDTAIVTADDDVYYAPDWLATLVEAVDPTTRQVVARHAHLAHVDAEGRARGYRQWGLETELHARPGPGTALFPVGIGGVLYPPGSLDPEVMNQAAFLELCPHADDVWLFWMALRAGATHRRAGGPFPMTNWPSSQRESLFKQNLKKSRNDPQIQAVEARYGKLGDFVGAANQ